MEYLDVVNENNELTGKTEERNIIHKEGIWHREVAVWIMNEKGEVLLQKRAATKKQSPNKWALTAVHIDAGEKIKDAIIREMEEELGIKVSTNELELLDIYKEKNKFYNNIKNYNFKYTYFFKTNKKIEDYKICLEELSEIKYISFSELEEIVKNKDENVTFSKQPYMSEVIEILRKKL